MEKGEIPDDNIHPQDFVDLMMMNILPSKRQQVCYRYANILRRLGRFDEAREVISIAYKISKSGKRKKDKEIFEKALLLFMKYYRRYKT